MAWLKNLVERRVPHYIGLYIGLVTGMVPFVDFLVKRYLLSPYLTDLLLLLAVLLFPSVVLVSYTHGRSGADRWGRAEKIGVPANLILAGLIVALVFGGKDLGAQTKSITVVDAEGKEETRQVAKEDYRRRLVCFFFERETGSPEWLSFGATFALAMDLSQDAFVDVSLPHNMVDRLRRAGHSGLEGVPLSLMQKLAGEMHRQYFLTGKVGKSDAGFSATVFLYAVEGARLVYQRSFSHTELFPLMDAMGRQLRAALNLPELAASRRLPVAQLFTASSADYAEFTKGTIQAFVYNDGAKAEQHLTAAIAADPDFAMAHYVLAQVQSGAGLADEAAASMAAAMDSLYRLPERLRFEIQAKYYQMQQYSGRRLALAQTWLELYPNDGAAYTLMADIQMASDDRQGAIKTLEALLERDSGQPNILHRVGNFYREEGNFKSALDAYERYLERLPRDHRIYSSLGLLHRLMGGHESARTAYERALVLDPTNVGTIISLADLEQEVGHFEEATRLLREAQRVARTPQERGAVLRGLSRYYRFRGRTAQALAAEEESWAEDRATVAPAEMHRRRLEALDSYVEAGQAAQAQAILSRLSHQLSPPWNELAPWYDLKLQLALGNAAAARKLLQEIEPSLESNLFIGLRAGIRYAEGRVLELEGSCDNALKSYQAYLDLHPTGLWIYTDLGRCHRRLGQLDEAQAALGRRLSNVPSDPHSLYQLALVHEARGGLQAARGHLGRALEVWADADPNYTAALEARQAWARMGGAEGVGEKAGL